MPNNISLINDSENKMTFTRFAGFFAIGACMWAGILHIAGAF